VFAGILMRPVTPHAAGREKGVGKGGREKGGEVSGKGEGRREIDR
jgi:hypothetical protein